MLTVTTSLQPLLRSYLPILTSQKISCMCLCLGLGQICSIFHCSNACQIYQLCSYYAQSNTPITIDGKLLVIMIVNLDVQRKCTMNQYIAW